MVKRIDVHGASRGLNKHGSDVMNIIFGVVDSSPSKNMPHTHAQPAPETVRLDDQVTDREVLRGHTAWRELSQPSIDAVERL
jgi:hypothetical protein